MMTMNMNDLELVTGGTVTETANDTSYFQVMGALKRHFDIDYTKTNWSIVSEIAKTVWAFFGVETHPNFDKPNTYAINGKEVTRWEAINHALSTIKSNTEL